VTSNVVRLSLHPSDERRHVRKAPTADKRRGSTTAPGARDLAPLQLNRKHRKWSQFATDRPVDRQYTMDAAEFKQASRNSGTSGDGTNYDGAAEAPRLTGGRKRPRRSMGLGSFLLPLADSNRPLTGKDLRSSGSTIGPAPVPSAVHFDGRSIMCGNRTKGRHDRPIVTPYIFVE
jgi:hypothetical protein